MRIAILTSGGDAPGMNATIRAVVRTCIFEGIEVYGIMGGYEGLIDAKFEKLIEASVADIIQRGGTILSTTRSERFQTDEGFEKALNSLKIFEIDALIVLGGDGSLRGAKKLCEAGINVVGIPCSIDNDMGYTDYTIGFMTAVRTVTEAISNIRDTTEAHGRANVVEVMGRECGDIALFSGVSSGAESIIVPEFPMNINEIAEKALVGKNRGKRHHIIIMAEGCGSAFEFAKEFEKLTGIDTRVTVLGYIQRGGAPSIFDRILASEFGYHAVYFAKDKKSGALGSVKGKIIMESFEDVFNIKKKFRQDLLEILKTVSI
ncbi:6-phosphofructokinase [Peptoniphilus sp. MSJ-1]|uniref:ATP-dependent 6-phosphofructokinase n=1 Tax=Peptoniphilus ovalis TaxID=2841503 RepID=A0ABS6FDJ6_9FIRM|nr:ATP-dependent 6-phosphofructokinase [Peptoniphilus ovalis]MBU5668256.1 6-phosphofructokinase [Peptoniphilus ovalis]